MKSNVTRARLGALAAASVAISSPVFAASYAWQTAGSTNTWSIAPGDTNWFIDAGVVLSSWADANAAVLAGATGENITLSATVAPTSTTVNDNANWTLSGTGVLGGTGGTLTKNGTGTLTIANTVANTFTGGTTLNAGTLSLGTGGTAADTTTVGALGSGAVAINGGTLRLWIRNNAAFTIANSLTVNGGNILNEDGNHTLSGTVSVGAGGATLRSKYTGKNLTLSNVISGTGALTIARSADGGGNVDATVILTNSNSHGGGTTVNSGVLQLGNVIATDKGATGVVRGTLTVNSPGSAVLGFINALGYATGQKVDTFNINGGTVTHTASGDQGWGITYNMTGGTLQSTGTGRFTFGANTSVNTLASASTANIGGFVRIREGNTGNTVNFTTADGAAFTDLAVNGVIEQSAAGFGITKLGAGLMQLNAANTYTGPTNVNAGTLVLGAGGSLATSPVVVNSTFISAAAGKTLPSLTANNGSTLGLVAAPGATTNVTGALNLADGASVSISPILGATTVGGTYDLVTAGSITGTGTPVASFGGIYGPSRATGSVAVVGNKLQLTVTGTGAALVWNNASAAGVAAGTWDTNLTANFNNGGGNDVFQAFDSVTFDDTVAAGLAKTVNVAGLAAPALVTVNNSTGNNYTLNAATSGAGSLAGSPSIVKSGTGSLILGANLLYNGVGGAITVSGGTFDLGAKTLPAQAKLTVDGGTLSNGTLPVSGTFDFRQGTVSAVLNGAGTFTKSTAGTVILSGNSAITGAGSVAEGTLQVGAAGAAGLIGTGAVSVATGATLAFNRTDAAVTIANALSGTGSLAFNGTNNGDAGAGIGNGQSGYILSGNNSGFSGAITVTNSRITLDNANDVGTAPITTGSNGGLLITAGTYPNAFTLAGNGWGEATGLLGALRLQGGIVSGPVTLAGNTRITSHSGAGTISGPIGESGGARNLELGGSGTATNFNTVLTLSGASTYTGTTSIGTAGGRTATVNLTGSLGNTAVTVNTGSTLNGNGSIAGSLNFAGATTNLGVNLALPGTLTVAGNTTFGGVTTVALTPSPGLTPGGSITLMTYGSATGAPANLALANPTAYRQALFTVGATALTLDIGSKALVWTGTGGLTWDIATTTNWTDTTPAVSAYYQGDVVTFDDTAGAANGAVTVSAAITPSTVTVNNSAAVPYTFSGAGSVGGNASLVKQGNGSMTVLIGMPYTGGTTISGGSVIVDGNQNFNRQGNGNQVTIAGGALFEVRGVNALPAAANAINATLQAGATYRVVTGTSASTSVTIPSHSHVNNLTLNGGVVDFTYAGTGLIYNAESVQLNGTLTVGGSAASTIQSLEPAANQGMALFGNRTFAVADATSSSASDLLVTAELENSDTNNGALTKTGTGTLELTAANSYTAGTTVTTGTLLANNGPTGSATGTGAVTVAATATLGGSGGATGAVTAAGTLSPGSPASPFGVLRTGATTLTGTYACQIDGVSADVLAVTGNIDLSGATLALSATGAGATEASYIVATWTGTRTSAFASVTGLPSGYGVVYDDTLREVRLQPVVTDGYLLWETANGIGGAGAGTDSDADGIPNGIEFVIGGDPSGPGSSSSALLPTVTVDTTYLNFQFRRTDGSAYLNPYAEYGTNLGTWTEAEAGVNGVVVNEENNYFGTGTDRVTVRIPRALAAPGSKFFARLRVDVP